MKKSVLRQYEAALPDLEINGAVWADAFDLARRARAASLTCPSPDVLIAACARYYGVGMEASDAHFPNLMAL